MPRFFENDQQPPAEGGPFQGPCAYHLLPWWSLILSFFRKDGTIPVVAVIAAFLLFFYGCAASPPASRQPEGRPRPYKVSGVWYQPLPDSKGFRELGTASWYGKDFHGKKTSNGEVYNMYDMTAAHKILPLGTYVRVHNLDNDRFLDVRINDRGPFVRGRIIDLSYAAAKELGLLEPGTARVEVVALGVPASADGGAGHSYVRGDYFSGNFTYQVGAFANRENAERLQRSLKQAYRNSHITIYDRGDRIFYRVRVGAFTSLEEAVRNEEVFINDGFSNGFLVAE